MALKFEILCRHIEALDSATFREVAQKCLEVRGFTRVTVSDGPDDAGRDIRVYETQSALQPIPFAVQVSVQKKNWKAKIKDDAKSARDQLNCTSFMYVTSRRIGDADFQNLEDTLRRDLGVTLSKMDQQDLAALISSRELVSWFLDAIGLSQEVEPRRLSLEDEVAESFILFSDQVHNFRQEMLRQAAITCAVHDSPCTRAFLIERMQAVLGLSKRGKELCESTVDRLLQRAELISHKKTIAITEDLRRAHQEARRLADAEWAVFVSNVGALLGKFGNRSRDSARRIAEKIGSIMLNYRRWQAIIVNKEERGTRSGEIGKFNSEARAVESLLLQEGIPEFRQHEVINELCGLADKNSAVGRLTAGEMFRRLASVDRSSLVRALGGDRSLEIYLEPSVIIPLLCAKLFGENNDSTGKVSLRLFELAGELAISLLAPDVYLEETATHLIDAANFLPILKSALVDDLRHSENAFVAFYARHREELSEFSEFLRTFGYRAGLDDFNSHRQTVTDRMINIVKRYGIVLQRRAPSQIKKAVIVKSEEDLSYIYRETGQDRAGILMSHDASVVAFLRSRSQEIGPAPLLATWDRTLQLVCRRDDFDWWALDPSSITDLLSLAVPGSGGASLAVEVALTFTPQVERQASAIWDELVSIERGNLNDANLLGKAEKFKNAYMERQQGDFNRSKIKGAWREWKARE
jgi:hypothetical protein